MGVCVGVHCTVPELPPCSAQVAGTRALRAAAGTAASCPPTRTGAAPGWQQPDLSRP